MSATRYDTGHGKKPYLASSMRHGSLVVLLVCIV
jgi:hypothetical protein